MRGRIGAFSYVSFAACLVLSFQSCTGALSLDTLFNKTSMETRTSESLASVASSRSVSSSAASYRIVAIADPHVSLSTWADGEKLAAWIAANASASVPVRALIIAGDLTDSAEENQYAAVRGVLDSVVAIPVAVLPVIGNHDLYSSEGWARWKKYIAYGSTWYPSVGAMKLYDPASSETLRAVLLDSAECAVGSAQLSFLKSVLGGTAPNIVVTHVPLVPVSDNNIWYLESDYERLSILSAMMSANAPLYIAGHEHSWSVRKVGSITQIVVGSFKDDRSMLILTINPSAGITWEMTKLQ